MPTSPKARDSSIQSQSLWTIFTIVSAVPVGCVTPHNRDENANGEPNGATDFLRDAELARMAPERGKSEPTEQGLNLRLNYSTIPSPAGF